MRYRRNEAVMHPESLFRYSPVILLCPPTNSEIKVKRGQPQAGPFSFILLGPLERKANCHSHCPTALEQNRKAIPLVQSDDTGTGRLAIRDGDRIVSRHRGQEVRPGGVRRCCGYCKCQEFTAAYNRERVRS